MLLCRSENQWINETDLNCAGVALHFSREMSPILLCSSTFIRVTLLLDPVPPEKEMHLAVVAEAMFDQDKPFRNA